MRRKKGIIFISPLHNSLHRSRLQAASAAKPIQLFKQNLSPPVPQEYLWGTICLCPSRLCQPLSLFLFFYHPLCLLSINIHLMCCG